MATEQMDIVNPYIDAYLPQLAAAKDDAVVLAILAKRKVDLIAICPEGGNQGLSPQSRQEGGFYRRLATGSLPPWIRAAALPAEAAAFRLFEVLSEGQGR